MVKVAVNTSPLIFLSKANLLKTLQAAFTDIYTSKAVIDEIEKPVLMGIVSRATRNILAAKWLKVVEPSKGEKLEARQLAKSLNIDYGEAEVALLYQKLNLDIMIVADVAAERKLSELGINAKDLSDLAWIVAQKGIMNVKEFANAIWRAGYTTRRIKSLL